jgi:RsiW-degrading membrane proteinase PrsW (M82 family)
MIGDVIIANVLASAFLIILIYFLDINEKEPPWTLVGIYALSILLTYVYGKLFVLCIKPFQSSFNPWFTNFFLAGFLEEFWKLLIVLVFVWPLKSFNDEADGIIYYLIIAAGFTVLENVAYSFRFVLHPYLKSLESGEMARYHVALRNIVLIRWFSGHIFINVVSGMFLGFAKKNRRIWLILVGFLASVILHGFWNQMALWGLFPIYVAFLLGADSVIFFWTVRHSFYFKFIRRLKSKVRELIQEAGELDINRDIQFLIKTIYTHIGALGRMQGEVMIRQAKVITETLPSKLADVPVEGERGLIQRFLKIYGILGQDRRATGGSFWFGLYLKFVLTGFFMVSLLMNFMIGA